jgi:recombinational DNA repair protein RecR
MELHRCDEHTIPADREEVCEGILRAIRQYMIVENSSDLHFIEKMMESHGTETYGSQLGLFDDRVRDFYR